MSTLLQKKIPVSNHYSYNIVDAVISTVLVFVCLIAFKPSFFSEIAFSDQVIIAIIISSVVLFVLLFKCLLVWKMEHSGRWTLKMDLITLLIEFLVISAILLALSPLVLSTWLKLPIPIDGQFAIVLVGFTHLIGVLLYFVSITFKHLIYARPDAEQSFQDIAPAIEMKEAVKKESPEIIIVGKNHGERVVIQKENLICISTNGHYIDIYIVDPSSKEVSKIVFRNSILAVANSLSEYDQFIQCHRSHLINMDHVEDLLGTSKKMEVKFKKLNLKIPVSRTKSALLLEMFKDRAN